MTPKDIIIKDLKGRELFRLDDGKKENTIKTTRQIYNEGIQWFEPEAKNYMELLSVNRNIGKIEGIKHFSWDDIINYADNNQSLLGYVYTGYFSDWKSNSEGADGYLLSTVDGKPYWSDAVGQIPFAINAMRSGIGLGAQFPISKEEAIKNVISLSQTFASGLIGDKDKSNSYDNLMILRGALFAAERFTVYRASHEVIIEHGMKSKLVDVYINTLPGNKDKLDEPIDKKTAKQYGY
jgi:hypothetical protein